MHYLAMKEKAFIHHYKWILLVYKWLHLVFTQYIYIDLSDKYYIFNYGATNGCEVFI